MLYRLTLSYRGEAYAGWQRQPNAIAVQQVLEEALEKLLGKVVRVCGAGRTDAGVHARGQVVHLEVESRWPPSALVHGTNHRLPPDIRVLGAVEAEPGFHARKSAVAKEYRYYLSRQRVVSALEAHCTVRAPSRLDVERFAQAASLIEGRHDFSAFAKAGGSHARSVRTIFLAKLDQARFDDVDSALVFRVVGDGFLRGMVRALVGTLLEVATQRRSLESLEALLHGRTRQEAGPNVAARGLVLHRVYYESDRPRAW